MSYDIYLCDPVTHKVIELDTPHFMRGGTYAVGGTKELWYNITFNYSELLYNDHDFTIPWLDGKEAWYATNEVERVISELKDDVDPDYWKATEGNAKRALMGLLAMMKMRPDALIKVCY